MTDVALSVAVVTAATGIVAASVPQVSSLVSDARKASRAQRERGAGDLRRACLDILSAAGDLRMKVDNAALARGDEMSRWLAEIRAAAAAVQLHAVSVALLVPGRLGECAQALADAAASLATAAAASTEPVAHQMVTRPDLAGLDAASVAFREAAVAHARGQAR
jgi:hypothetical protein